MKNKNKTGVGDAQVGAQNIILFPIPKHSKEYNNINKLVHVLLGNPNDNFVKNALSDKINKIYGLNKTEIQYLTCLNL